MLFEPFFNALWPPGGAVAARFCLGGPPAHPKHPRPAPPPPLGRDAGEKVAIKKITNVFDHVSDATRILREIKLLRLLRHPDIVEVGVGAGAPWAARRAFRWGGAAQLGRGRSALAQAARLRATDTHSPRPRAPRPPPPDQAHHAATQPPGV